MTNPERLPESQSMFQPRPGVGIEEDLAVLEQPPEVILTPEQHQEVLQFEEELTRGIPLIDGDGRGLDIEKDGKTIELMGLEGVAAELKVTTAEIYLDYFSTDFSYLDAPKKAETIKTRHELLSKLNVTIPPDTTPEDLQAILAEYPYGSHTKDQIKALSTLASESRKAAEGIMVNALKQANYDPQATSSLENPKRTTVVQNPDVLIKKVIGFRALKYNYRDYAVELQQQDDPTSQAKLVMLNIHQRRLNQLIEEVYPQALALFRQHQTLSPENRSPEFNEQIETLQTYLYGFGGKEKSEDEKRKEALFDQKAPRTLARLDRARYGAQSQGEGKDYTVVSQEAKALAEQLRSQAAQDSNEPAPSEAIFAHIPPERYQKEVIVTADEWQGWAKEILAEYDLLSSDSDYSPTRSGTAPDGKWQAVLTDEDGLSVDGKQKVVKIPKTFKRPIGKVTVPAGAAQLLDHEIGGHVFQNENQSKLVNLAMTKRVGLEAEADREAGAIVLENQAVARLFGKTRPINTHYLAAIEAKLAGGTFKESMMAFYRSTVDQSPTMDNKQKESAARAAFDRTLRIFRSGGELEDASGELSDSKNLVYLEQELIAQQLREHPNGLRILLSGVDARTLRELHRVGMVDLSAIRIPERMPSEIVLDKIKTKLD